MRTREEVQARAERLLLDLFCEGHDAFSAAMVAPAVVSKVISYTDDRDLAEGTAEGVTELCRISLEARPDHAETVARQAEIDSVLAELEAALDAEIAALEAAGEDGCFDDDDCCGGNDDDDDDYDDDCGGTEGNECPNCPGCMNTSLEGFFERLAKTGPVFWYNIDKNK